MLLLRQRHAGDVFVEECKDGPTQVSGVRHVRLDAWAMPKSWSKPDTHGYELKVSRKDFLRDEKWRDYLRLCHRFWFVCPRGMIQPEELPQDVGLLWASSNMARLVAKRTAVPRDVQIPETLWRYILMCRAKIQREAHGDSSPLDYWRQWLKERGERKDLGYRVRSRIREIVDAVNAENESLRKRMEGYDLAIERLKDAGFDVSHPISTWELRRRIDELRGAVPTGLVSDVETAIARLSSLRSELAKLGCMSER